LFKEVINELSRLVVVEWMNVEMFGRLEMQSQEVRRNRRWVADKQK
jgi:hypothetical protein